MEKNLFEGAEFGTMFRTRDGRRAIFIAHYDSSFHSPEHVQLIVEKVGIATDFHIDGRIWRAPMCQYGINWPEGIDIVSRYHESIDEEKLSELADEYALNYWGSKNYPEYGQIKQHYIAGYRKAMEE